MKEKLFVIADISGSMADSGKTHITRNLCNYITQLHSLDSRRFQNVEFLFHKWNSAIEQVSLTEKEGFPLLPAEKSAELEVLSAFLNERLTETLPLRVLILSDGNYAYIELAEFVKMWSGNDQVQIRTVAVGADSDLDKLKRISMGYKVYLAENISAAIQSVLQTTGSTIKRPMTLDDLSISENAEVEEEWE